MEAAEATAFEAEAEYQDGQQARPLWLRARLTASVLELRRAGGEPVASWPLSALRIVDRAAGVLRLAPEGSDARLLVSDARLASALEAAQRPRRRAALKRGLRIAAVAAVAVPAAAFGLWHGWPPAADAIARAVPADWERSIGAATAAAVVGGKRVCDAPEGRAALDGLAAKLVAAGGAVAPAAVRVRVVDDPTVNALAAPGGEIIVFRGLLDRAGSADELAGVIAHEMGHVEHRHGLRGVARAAGLFVLTGALSGGSDAVALGAALVSLSYGRDFERDADAAAARTLAAAGIGTAGLQAFFARMERERPDASGGLWDYLGTHPSDADRAAALGKAERPAALAPALPAAEWAALRRVCGSVREERQRVGPSKAAGRPVRAARARERSLGTFGAWEAWIEDEAGGPACYALAHAIRPEGEARSARARLWVTHRPWRRMEDISFVPDRKPPDGTRLGVAFGERRAALRMGQTAAWPRDTAALSAALRAAAAEGVAEVTIDWPASPEGEHAPARSHRFALDGLVEAHAAIGEACKDES